MFTAPFLCNVKHKFFASGVHVQDLVEAVQVVPALHKFLLFGLFAVAMAVPQKHIVASFDGSEATPAMAALPSDGEQSVVCAATEAHY